MTPEPADALLDKLRDRDAVVRCQAAREIGTAKLRAGVRELIQVLADDASAPVRRAAAEALGRIGDGTARGPLERALRSAEGRRGRLHSRPCGSVRPYERWHRGEKASVFVPGMCRVPPRE